MRRPLRQSFSTGGLLLGALFFGASLTPTLLPRKVSTQGMLSGCALATGYGIWVFGEWLWVYMELPQLNRRLMRVANGAAAASGALVAVISLWHAARWQNSIREVMELKSVDTAHPLEFPTGLCRPAADETVG
jgi:uncharacterized membrane protein